MLPARRGLAAAALAAALAAPGCAGRRDASEWAGSARCAACHAAAAREWTGSAHALAARPADAADVQASFTGAAVVTASLRVRPIVRDGRRQLETDAVPEGRLVPAFVLGTREIEQFLVPGPRGRWQALPAAYDVEAREWFDVFPEVSSPDDWAHWRNPGATANAECLECHVTAYERGYDAAADAYRTRWGELGVGCEACHGPGARHAAAAEAGRREPYGGTAAADTACAACHSRRVPLTARYTPGDALDDAFDFELLDSGAYHADGHVREEAYEWTSLQMSRMGVQGVTCRDCHEPHGGGLRAAGDALCLRCHDARLATAGHTHHAADGLGARCVACHMPEGRFMERDDRREHLLDRPDPRRSALLGVPDPCMSCHAERPPDWAAERVEAWFPDTSGERTRRRAVTAAFAGAARGMREAVPELVAIVADRALDVPRRASAARVLGAWLGEPGVRATLVAAAGDPAPAVRAGAVQALGAEAPDDAVRAVLVQAAADPARLVRVEAGFALRAVPPDGGPADDAVATWLAAQRVLDDVPETHFNRGVFWQARGDARAAEGAYRAALRLWPADAAARYSLALLLADGHRDEEAEDELRSLLAREPAPPAATFALGLLAARHARWDEAVRHLEACRAAAPDYPRVAYDLGVAYAQLGRQDDARRALEAATDDPAARRDALRELVGMAYTRGDRALLERWLPDALLADPGVAQDARLRDALGAADAGG
jgi:predicted CXXCH cytochrome family protein